jgi:hypothetical protein
LVSSGHVITMECFEKLIKKDWLHPLNGEKLTEKDIIPLQRVRSIIYIILVYCFFCILLIFLNLFIRVEQDMQQQM